MNWYKCDICGTPVQRDPGDPHICNECEDILARQHRVARRYAGVIRQEDNQYEINMEELTV